MKTKFVVLSILMLTCLTGQVSIQDRFRSTAFTYKGVPGTSANIPASGRTFHALGIVVTNSNSSSIQIRARDRSTDCEGGGCPLIPDDVTIPAKTVVEFNFPYVEVTSGMAWTSTIGTAVVLRVVGTY